MRKPLKVLIIENSEDDAILVTDELRQAGYEPAWKIVDNAIDFAGALALERWDVILSDYAIPGFSGLKALEIYKTARLDAPFLFVSGEVGEERVAEAMRSGAHDYVMKDHASCLGPAIERELTEAARRSKRRDAELELYRVNAELRQLTRELREKVDLLSPSPTAPK